MTQDHSTLENAPPRLLPMAEVLKRVSLSRATVYRLIGFGEFPNSVQVTECRVAWLEADINDWVNAKAKARGDRC